MAQLKINNEENYEHLCTIKLTKEQFPIAYKNKVDELVSLGMAKEEAEKDIAKMEIELELYYHEGHGCFAVETDFAANTSEMFSPFNGEKVKYESDNF